MANYGFHNPRVDYFTNSYAINSDGKMTTETQQMDGTSVALSKAADNQNFDQLDTLVDKDGAVWSKQSDGSYLFVIHISPETIRQHVNIPNSLKSTNTVVFDKDEAKANQETQHFYNDGAMKGLPACIIPEIRVDYNNYSTTAPVYAMHIFHKQGNQYVEVYNGAMSPVVDTSSNKGQAGIVLHYLNGQSGDAMQGTTVSTTFGQPGSSETITIPTFEGYHLRNTSVVNNAITFDNGAKQTVKSGDIILNNSNQTITLPGADQVSNVYLVFDGDSRTDTIKYLDEDDNNKELSKDSVSGKVGEIKPYDTNDKIKDFNNYYIYTDELAKANQSKGIKGIEFDASGDKTYCVYLKHKTSQSKEATTVTETINYNYKNGKVAQSSAEQNLTFNHYVTKDLVTGKNVVDKWDAEHVFPPVTSPEIQGYTADKTIVKDVIVKHSDNNIVIDVVYTPDQQTAKVSYIYDDTKETLKTDVFNGVTD